MRQQASRPGATEGSVDQVVAWAADAVVCLYFAWICQHLWKSTASFAQMYEGLGAQLPPPTRFVVEHGGWLYPTVFGLLALVLVAKELLLQDKRLSTAVTFLLACAGQFGAHWVTTLYYLPMFELIRKLGG